MKTLYRFDLDEHTGEIVRTEFTEYEERKSYAHFYRFRRKSQIAYCYNDDIDRFKTGHVYSWDSSYEHAKDIISMAVAERYEKAKRESERWGKVLFDICARRYDE